MNYPIRNGRVMSRSPTREDAVRHASAVFARGGTAVESAAICETGLLQRNAPCRMSRRLTAASLDRSLASLLESSASLVSGRSERSRGPQSTCTRQIEERLRKRTEKWTNFASPHQRQTAAGCVREMLSEDCSRLVRDEH